MSLATDIFSESDQTLVPVPTPEWPSADGKLFARSLSALEMDRFQQRIRKAKEDQLFFNTRAVLVQLGTVAESGDQVFSPGDVARLADRSAAPVERLWGAIWKASGQDEEDKKALVKNSETIPAEDLQSDLQNDGE